MRFYLQQGIAMLASLVQMIPDFSLFQGPFDFLVSLHRLNLCRPWDPLMALYLHIIGSWSALAKQFKVWPVATFQGKQRNGSKRSLRRGNFLLQLIGQLPPITNHCYKSTF